MAHPLQTLILFKGGHMKSSLIKAVKVVVVLGFSMQAYAERELRGGNTTNEANQESNVNINNSGVKQPGDLNVIQAPDSDLVMCQKALKTANNSDCEFLIDDQALQYEAFYKTVEEGISVQANNCDNGKFSSLEITYDSEAKTCLIQGFNADGELAFSFPDEESEELTAEEKAEIDQPASDQDYALGEGVQ